MKVIITIGSMYSGYMGVERILNQAGISSAQAGSKASLGPQALQTQLLRSHEVDLTGGAPMAQVQPGKLWNELATDLFLTNMQQPNWGWADPQSAVLMDFWHDFDAQVRLLLVYNSPADYLTQVLIQNTPPSTQQVEAALDEWVRWNTALLRYMHRHPDYCLLVSSEYAVLQPLNFLDAVAAHWQISGLDTAAVTGNSRPDFQHLQAHLVNRLIDKHHPALALYQELQGASFLPTDPSLDSAESLTGNPHSTWNDWVNASTQLVKLNQENAVLARASEKAGELNTGLKQESEHLLLQLHEVQQELESYFLKNEALTQSADQAETITRELKDAQIQRDALAQANASLTAARELATQAQTDALAQLDCVRSENAALTRASEKAGELNTGLKQESEHLLLQLHEVQQELEEYFLLYQQAKSESDLKTKTTSLSTDFWLRHQPQELVIDLLQDIAGSNWYAPESEGRWAGPATLSTLQMPPLQAGDYTLELDIVDAMHLDIVKGMVVEAFNQTHPVEVSYPLYKGEYPLVCKVPISISANIAAEPWLIGLRFPQLVSPSDNGSDDKRNLAIRLRTLCMVKKS